jgi:hypothetical protein
MRLGQLARKLSLRQSALVDFLAQQQIQIDGGSNTRIEDDHVVLIMKHFAPEQETSMRTELANEKMVERVHRPAYTPYVLPAFAPAPVGV